MSYPQRGGRPDARPPQSNVAVNPDFAKTASLILDGDARLLVDSAEKLAGDLKNDGLMTSQIRGIFGTVRRIELSWPRSGADELVRKQKMSEVLMLRPRLAYQAKRHRPVERLEQELRPLIDGVGEDRERFQRFVDFFEAVVAYHRAAGGS